MIDLAVQTYGRLDAAFNNAGINCDATPMAETDDEVFDRLININLRGAWICMKGELRQMMAQGSGAIVISPGGDYVQQCRVMAMNQCRKRRQI